MVKPEGSRMSALVGRAARMMAGTLASRVLGLLREVLTAGLFGATRSLDAFNVAYTLANISRQLLAEGALSASFVPVFSRVHKRDGAAASGRLARQVMAIVIAACLIVIFAGVILSGPLVSLIAPGFDAERASLAVTLTRALFPFLMLVSVGALAMGVLNSVGSFFVSAVAPAASNAAFIIILLIFYFGGYSSNASMWPLVAAVLAGGACSAALQCLWAGKTGFNLLPAKPDMSNPDLRETMKLFLPYAAGLSLNQVNPVISRMLGSFLEGGVISSLTYADRIIQLPLGLFVIAISQAVLPMLSRIDRDDTEGFRAFIRDALRFNLFIVLPAAVGLAMLSRPIVHLLLFRGAFDARALEITSGALACYAAGLPGMACGTVLMRALYARSMPKGAIRVTLFTVCANLAAGVALMQYFSYRGLAMGTSLAFTFGAFFGAWSLSRDIGLRIGIFSLGWAARLLLPCAAMGGAIFAAVYTMPYPSEAAFAARSRWTAAMVTGGILVYTITSILIRSPELAWVKEALRKKR
ncbi:putative lipid II flippase MurJ [Synergistales bacterium]|nr:putative lipid II flippase MurJ [Synergistales bacterium]